MTDNSPYDEIFNNYPETFEEKLSISIQYAQMVVEEGIEHCLAVHNYNRCYKQTGCSIWETAPKKLSIAMEKYFNRYL